MTVTTQITPDQYDAICGDLFEVEILATLRNGKSKPATAQRWQPFSVEELRRLQEVLSNNIENIQADCVDDDGQQTVSTDLDEAMLEEVLTEINQRLVVA